MLDYCSGVFSIAQAGEISISYWFTELGYSYQVVLFEVSIHSTYQK